MFKPKLPQQEQGFTLVEVLVAILITTIFTLVAMQAMVLAAVFKARARQSSNAIAWIQQNLENAKAQTTIDNLPHVNDDNSTTTVNEESQKCGTAPTSIESNGYGAALQDKLPALNTTKSATIETQTFTALANTATAPNPRPVGGAKLWLLRNAKSPTPPYNVLKISYAVVRDVGGSPSTSSVAILHTELIPDAAFTCPAP